MKTVCTLNGKLIMSQEGYALVAMELNAAQHPGAQASVLSDEDYLALLASQPKPVPSSVTMRQARLALLQQGLLSQVETAVASAGQAAQIEWEFSNTLERNKGLVLAIGSGLGLTNTQIDDLFKLAATL